MKKPNKHVIERQLRHSKAAPTALAVLAAHGVSVSSVFFDSRELSIYIDEPSDVFKETHPFAFVGRRIQTAGRLRWQIQEFNSWFKVALTKDSEEVLVKMAFFIKLEMSEKPVEPKCPTLRLVPASQYGSAHGQPSDGSKWENPKLRVIH